MATATSSHRSATVALHCSLLCSGSNIQTKKQRQRGREKLRGRLRWSEPKDYLRLAVLQIRVYGARNEWDSLGFVQSTPFPHETSTLLETKCKHGLISSVLQSLTAMLKHNEHLTLPCPKKPIKTPNVNMLDLVSVSLLTMPRNIMA